MFKRHLHRRIAAWLALLAVGLMVVAPGISQVLRSRTGFAELGAWCEGRAGLVARAPPMAQPSSDMPGMAPSSMHGAMSGTDHAAGSDMGDMSMDACGYCSLFCHAPTVPSTVAFMPMLVPAATVVPAQVPAPPLPMAPRTPVAVPRGPPAFPMT